MKAARLVELLDAGFAVPPFVTFGVGSMAAAEEVAGVRKALGPGPFAVRSSAVAEDLADGSFAGMYDTVLDVESDDALLAAIRTVRASGSNRRVAAYDPAAAGGPIGVIVQRMVPAVFGGVAYSHGATGRDTTVSVIAVAGSPAPLVEGVAVGESWSVVHDSYSVVSAPAAAALAVEVAVAVARLAVAVAAHAGSPQEIEWAHDGRQLWLLQARPTTAAVRANPTPSPAVVEGPHAEGEVVVSGIAASPGVAGGTVRVVLSVDGLSAVEPGDVLVAPTTEPAWTPVFGIVAAVVTDIGSLAAHAAVVAREFGIPAVVGTTDATTRLATGDVVVVDGDAGAVRRDR